MLPLTEMLGPSGPLVATRQGAPSSQAERIKSRIFWLIGIGLLINVGDRTLGRTASRFQPGAGVPRTCRAATTSTRHYAAWKTRGACEIVAVTPRSRRLMEGMPRSPETRSRRNDHGSGDRCQLRTHARPACS